MRFHQARNGRCPHGVEHPGNQQEQAEGDIADDLALGHGCNDCTNSQNGPQQLAHHQQLLTGKSIGNEPSQWPNEQQWKRSQNQPPQERQRGVARVQIKQQHLGQSQRCHGVSDLRRHLASHGGSKVASTQNVSTAHVLFGLAPKYVKVHRRRNHSLSVTHYWHWHCGFR